MSLAKASFDFEVRWYKDILLRIAEEKNVKAEYPKKKGAVRLLQLYRCHLYTLSVKLQAFNFNP